jgi:AcrR family transcriptional regulator
MEQTRLKLLETLAELLAEEVDDVSVAGVAERAKVSVRTAYRYFPTRDAMFDAFNDWMKVKLGQPMIPTKLEDMPSAAAELVAYFQANERLMRASKSLPGRELRKRRKAEQVKGFTKMVDNAVTNLDADQIRIRAAAMHQLIGSDVWIALRDHWGLDQAQAIEAMQWGIRALTAQLHTDDSKAKRRK